MAFAEKWLASLNSAQVGAIQFEGPPIEPAPSDLVTNVRRVVKADATP
jgi:hypothetical protein